MALAASGAAKATPAHPGYGAGMLIERMAPFTSTIFAEMSALAVRTSSVNLGQGFPDTDGPAQMLEAAAAALRDGPHQ